MNGALGIGALFAAFVFLVYAAKGSHGTQWDGQIAPGPVLGQLFLGHWPYGAASSSSSTPGGSFVVPPAGGGKGAPGFVPSSVATA